MKKEISSKNTFFSYKNKPLVRCKDTLYYGDMSDDYVVKLHIKKTVPTFDMDIANKVSVQLISTDPELGPRKRIIKSSEKDGLYLALDIAEAWLEKALTAGDAS
ncbi:MAG: hypothetical protein RUMPE_00587 [Eubacteriales bacterium SKADARSKE-1]|nr:hypothetical protein [Eubacteriales bacterium SKADARSKE-1]